MPQITPNVVFEHVAREWRCVWSADADKATLSKAQDALAKVTAQLHALEGVTRVQRIASVPGAGTDFKVITTLKAPAFAAWEKAGFAPEAQLLADLKKANCKSIETQTYTIADVSDTGKVCTGPQLKITNNVTYNTLVRELRGKWSVDNNKASLSKAQEALTRYAADLRGIKGALRVQRIVCGGCQDFKVLVSVAASDFPGTLAPEAQLLAELKKAGLTGVETSTYSIADITLPQVEKHEHYLDGVKRVVAELIVAWVKEELKKAVSAEEKEAFRAALTKPNKPENGELAFPSFVLAKVVGGNPAQIATSLAAAMNKKISGGAAPDLLKAAAAGPYVNFYVSVRCLAKVLPAIISGDFTRKLAPTKQKVMIEYSQPNTHKAFHVGHMRNAALGDSLVRFYEQVGYPVTAVNYFGDEGAHVSKCLWYLNRQLKEKKATLATLSKHVPERKRGEWLGDMYSSAVAAIDLKAYTSLPFGGTFSAKVVKIEPHPSPDAPKAWHKVTVEMGGKSYVVVSAAEGYMVGDVVAYVPVGSKLAGKKVEVKDFKGVESQGAIVLRRELEMKPLVRMKRAGEVVAPAPEKPAAAGPAKETGVCLQCGRVFPSVSDRKKHQADEGHAQRVPSSIAVLGEAKSEEGAGKGGKAKKEKEAPKVDNDLFLLPGDTPTGVELAELGRYQPGDPKLENVPLIPDPKTPLVKEIDARVEAVKQTLLDMEAGKKEICALWEETKQWSLVEFKHIYAWLDCRFDHDFFESECGEESVKMVHEEYKKGTLVNSDGAIGCDLTKEKLGFCMLLKSNGSGLYATKDLALARRKFTQFQVEKSLYIVDAAQTLHFQQVFATLLRMGYDNARFCKHLPYGLVILPDGKMSSRVGNVIYFTTLQDMLAKQIRKDFLSKKEGEWPENEIEEAIHKIAVATIKYGMLNHDTAKDIVFQLEDWAAKSGNTGPYMMYAYARIKSIMRETGEVTAKPNLDLLGSEAERAILGMLNDVWLTVDKCVENNNPSPMCDYIFALAKAFSSWYEMDGNSVKNAQTEELKATRVAFIEGIAEVLKMGLKLLGISTLERM